MHALICLSRGGKDEGLDRGCWNCRSDPRVLAAESWSLSHPGRTGARASRGGDLVDFWGAGFDVAERMGIVPELRRRGCVLTAVRAVDRDGHRIASFSPSAIMGRRSAT